MHESSLDHAEEEAKILERFGFHSQRVDGDELRAEAPAYTDDVVGAIPAHLVAGIWGTTVVPLSHGGGLGIDLEGGTPSYLGQFIGVLACGIFVSIVSAIVWMALKVTIGVRPSEEDELAGMDKSEVGLEAYPEFG